MSAARTGLVLAVVALAAFLLGRLSVDGPVGDRAPDAQDARPLSGAVPAPQLEAGAPPPSADAEPDEETAREEDDEAADAEEAPEPAEADAEEAPEPAEARERALQAVRRQAWEGLLAAAPHLDAAGRAAVDAALIEAARTGSVTPWNSDGILRYYLWKTRRGAWADMERFVLDGIATREPNGVAAFAVAALHANPPPERAWFEWLMRHHEMPAEVVTRIKAHLAERR